MCPSSSGIMAYCSSTPAYGMEKRAAGPLTKPRSFDAGLGLSSALRCTQCTHPALPDGADRAVDMRIAGRWGGSEVSEIRGGVVHLNTRSISNIVARGLRWNRCTHAIYACIDCCPCFPDYHRAHTRMTPCPPAAY